MKASTAASTYGFFNGWCASCNEMADEDSDGVYTATVRATEGEMEYKFTLDGGAICRKCSRQEQLVPRLPVSHQPLGAS